ncbi:helix-turn-helix transcriptional regulator [Streptomyces hyaluromycini]|uniref:helix-turn-helix transcriptional regulator n=1 Tax=Streptomyces hyaluromycini TaxID=1377993 RepID=UPI000B5C7DEC|nr:LuxR C-terminal-related transcriptional regulator [Streptomyces hyaluromycini]
MTQPSPELADAMHLLAEEAERTRSGGGRLVLLRGATGTGRTTVLEAAAEQAAALGLKVLRARCSPGDTSISFATVLQLLGPVPEFADLAVDGDERATAAGLWRVLRAYAEDSPLLVAVDDVHLADAPSHRWLVESARHIDRLPILLVVSERSQYDLDPPAPGFTHTLPPALVRTHTLAPLAPAAAAARVRAKFPDASRLWTDACVHAAAGSPLLLGALLDDLAESRHPDVPETTAALYPGAYPAAVQWLLDSAGPATTEVARALAVLEEDPGTCLAENEITPLLAELADADPTRVAGWLTAMTNLGLLTLGADGRPHFPHPLLRDAILAGVPAARRRTAHRAIAEAMLHQDAPAEAVARQLLATGPVDAPWALPLLQDAAAVALYEDRAEDAVGYLRRALEEPLSGGHRQRLLTELGSLEYAAPRSSAAIPRLAEAVRLPAAPQDRVRAAVALGTALTGRGRTRKAVELLHSVDVELDGHPDLVRTLHTASVLLSDQDQEVRQEVYRRLSETADRSPELVGTAGQALLVRHAASAGLTSARDAMRQLRSLLAEPADPLTEPFLVGTAATVAQWADELDEANRLVDRGLAGQRPDLLHPMHQALLNSRTDIAAARADYARLAVVPDAVTPTNSHAHTLVALVETGRTAQAAGLVAGIDLREAPDSWELNRFLYARGVVRAAAGDAAAALHDFLECGRRQTAREVISPVVTPWRTAAAECRLALDRPLEAIALAEEELRLARVWGTPRTVGRALRVLGTATGGRRGLELTEEAVRLLRDGGPAGTEPALALIALGRQLTAAGEAARARDCLREAEEHAERLGAVRLLELAEGILRKGGARSARRRTGAASLTGSERRIAELAAEGRTNVEIAALLHLARRTVETHLTHTYRKLGIRRRTDLRPALDQTVPHP